MKLATMQMNEAKLFEKTLKELIIMHSIDTNDMEQSREHKQQNSLFREIAHMARVHPNW